MSKKKRWVLAAIAVTVCLLSRGLQAQPVAIGTVREEPAATLLLPYFEVDLGNPAGRLTRFWINNASATAILAHVTIWSEMAVPVFAFNVYLTGYDRETINMRGILQGALPQTASAGQDNVDQISPKGPLSQDINFASCTGTLPPAQLSAGDVAALQAALTGASSAMLGGKCAGRESPGTARGFVTIDTVNNCTLRLPGDPGYFGAGGTGDATNQNVLWGDFAYANGNAPIQGAPLVAIPANATDPLTSTSGGYTFYGRLVDWNASDNRQPLATNFAARYVRGITEAIAWRDPKVAQQPFTCGTLPEWYPLGEEGIVIFDQQEHPEVPTTYPVAPQPPNPGLVPFPVAAQTTLVGQGQAVNGVLPIGAFPVSFTSGWIYYNLNTTVIAAGSNPPADPAASQAWLMTIRSVVGSAGPIGLVGGPATQLDSAATPVHFIP